MSDPTTSAGSHLTREKSTNAVGVQTVQCFVQEPQKSEELDRESVRSPMSFRKYFQGLNLNLICTLLNTFWSLGIYVLNLILFLLWNSKETSCYVLFMMLLSSLTNLMSTFPLIFANPKIFFKEISMKHSMIIKIVNLTINILTSFLTIKNIVCITSK